MTAMHQHITEHQHVHMRKSMTVIVPIIDVIECFDPEIIRRYGSGETAAVITVNEAIDQALHLWSKHGWNILMRISDQDQLTVNNLMAELAYAEMPTQYQHVRFTIRVFQSLYPYMLAAYKEEPHFLDAIQKKGMLGDDLILEVSFIQVY